MDPRHKAQKAQNVLQCHYCEIPDPPMYCEICKMHMCDACSEKPHLLNIMTEHRVISVKKREKTPKSKEHS